MGAYLALPVGRPCAQGGAFDVERLGAERNPAAQPVYQLLELCLTDGCGRGCPIYSFFQQQTFAEDDLKDRNCSGPAGRLWD